MRAIARRALHLQAWGRDHPAVTPAAFLGGTVTDRGRLAVTRARFRAHVLRTEGRPRAVTRAQFGGHMFRSPHPSMQFLMRIAPEARGLSLRETASSQHAWKPGVADICVYKRTPSTADRRLAWEQVVMCQGVVVRQWRCTRCRKLLGVVRNLRIHLRFGGDHEYLVTCPATTICRRCRTLNEVDSQGGPWQE